jgi:hemerythrin-like metal-binding protein
MFEWDPKYGVNIASIDGQHLNLFRIAAELYAAMSAGRGKASLSRILNRLVRYTAIHFAHAERLMLLHDYPDLAAHQAEHQALTKQVLTFQADFDAGRAPMTVQVLRLLKDWLQQHTTGSDQKYAPYLKRKQGNKRNRPRTARPSPVGPGTHGGSEWWRSLSTSPLPCEGAGSGPAMCARPDPLPGGIVGRAVDISFLLFSVPSRFDFI